MPLKRAEFISYGNDTQCEQTQKYIEDAGILLNIRDIGKTPLSEIEIDRLIGHFNLQHFLNPLSAAYKKHGLDKQLPEREEIIRLIAEDHTLLRRPIIRTGRLVTVGCDKKSISDMLQLHANGNGNKPSGHERKSQKGHSRVSASAAK
jgi:arsenate reductase-like glutaredoxin family protein